MYLSRRAADFFFPVYLASVVSSHEDKDRTERHPLITRVNHLCMYLSSQFQRLEVQGTQTSDLGIIDH